MYQTYGPVLDALRVRGISADVLHGAAQAADDSGRELRDLLVEQRVVTEIELAEALAEAYGLKSVDLAGYAVDPGAMAKIPLTLSRRHRVLGILLDGDEIVVGLADP